MSASRYSRQVAVPGIGERGQAAIHRAEVSIEGHGLAAEVCALYLIGAGVKAVHVDARLEETCNGRNSHVELVARRGLGDRANEDPACLEVRFPDEVGESATLTDRTPSDDPVLRGSRAARWALARILARSHAEPGGTHAE